MSFTKITFIFASRPVKDKAEQAFSNAGEVVTVLHAVCREGCCINYRSEAVLNVQCTYSEQIEGDGK